MAASSNGPGGYSTGSSQIVVTQSHMRNYWSPALEMGRWPAAGEPARDLPHHGGPVGEVEEDVETSGIGGWYAGAAGLC